MGGNIGKPDWSNALQVVGQNAVGDFAELAARLGSIVNVYRTGNVIYLNAFEDNNATLIEVEVASGTIADYSTLTNSGSNCKKINLSGSGNDVILLQKVFPIYSADSFGLSYAFATVKDKGQHNIIINHFKDNVLYTYELLYTQQNDTFSVKIPGGYSQVRTYDLGFNGTSFFFSNIKLVLDLANNRYSHFIINGDIISLTHFAPPSQAVTFQNAIGFNFRSDDIVGLPNEYLLDDLVITIDEPVLEA